MWLLEPHDPHVPGQERMRTHWQMHHQVNKREKLPPVGHMAYGENRQVPCVSAGHEQEKKAISLFPWDYISLGVGQTKYFLNMTN